MADYIQIRVVRRLRWFVRKHFGCDILFADENGWVHGYEPGEKFWTGNPVCSQMTRSHEGFTACVRHCRSAVASLRDAVAAGDDPQPVQVRCHAGFDRLFIPVVDGDELVGFIKIGALRRRPFDDHEVSDLVQLAKDVGEDPDEMAEAAGRVPVYDDESIDQLEHLLQILVAEIVEFRHEIGAREHEIGRLQEALGDRYRFTELIGQSQPMAELFELLDKVSQADSPVLITGENGTGKELVAKSIHYNSPRRQAPFVAQNCAAFNDNLLESELFGHVRGAFTGASESKKGLFDLANGGTFFLDEIAEMSPALQAKLLRVLQDGTFTPVGSTTERKVEVRVLAATNRDLEQMVEEGTFRQDLFYRINVVQVALPPLRERTEDIPLLVEHFLRRHAGAGTGRVPVIEPEVIAQLKRYDWPGNVRELENEVERMIVLSAGQPTIDLDVLSRRIREERGDQLAGGPSVRDLVLEVAAETGDYAAGRDTWANRYDEIFFSDLLRRHSGNIAAAARDAGVHRMAIYRWLRKHGRDAKDFVNG